MPFDPSKDGIDHINVYSKGKTELGRLLSNFADTSFELPDKGSFRTVEGFWYWTMTGRDELRNLLGWECKSKGRELENVRTHPTKEELKEAYLAKLEAHPDIKLRLMFNSLPLAHYYVYNGKVVEPQEWQWTAKLWEEIKIELR